MIYVIYIQWFTSVHLKPKFVLIYINLYNLHLYLLIHLSYVLYSASIGHAGISAIENSFIKLLLLCLVKCFFSKMTSLHYYFFVVD